MRSGSDRPPAQGLRLSDGRRLAWYEYGDPGGRPCVYITGTPASGVAGGLYHAAARQAGVRWISVDKPGYGGSDFQRGRRLLDWPQDVRALADHLGLDRFAVAGESGGGPHALALAYGLPQRVTAALVIAGMGPGHEAWVRQGMKPMNRRLLWLAQHAPGLLRWALRAMARTLSDAARRERWVQRQLRASPPADRALFQRYPELMPLTLDAACEALRPGPEGAAQELQMLASPWGFDPARIQVPVWLWHGTEDVNVPVAVARALAAAIPDCQAHFIAGAGHALYEHRHEMVQALRTHAIGV